MTSGVYWFYQPSLDRAIYVGSSSGLDRRRADHHRMLRRNTHFNPHLQRCWNKYGERDIQFLVLEECRPELLVDREQFWMDAIDPICNVSISTDNPRRGRKCTPLSSEHKLKISKGGKGRAVSDTAKIRIGNAHRGKIVSEETRHKLSVAARGRIPSNKGKKASESARKNMSVAQQGRTVSEETRLKMSISKIGHAVSAESRRKASESNSGHAPTRTGPHSEGTKRKMREAWKIRRQKNKPKDHIEEVTGE